MGQASLSFWPDTLPVADILPPVAILRQAAGELPAKSRNVFEAEIISTRVTEEHGEEMVHQFNIVVPGLGRFTYPLLEVRHNLELVYPAYVTSPDGNSNLGSCNTQEELIDCVRQVLNSPRVNSILYSLAARLSAPENATE